MTTRTGRHAPAGSSLRAIRLRARAPRALLMLTLGVLCVAGLRSIAAPRRPLVRTAPARSSFDLGAASFAQSFAQAYLTWDGAHPAAREAQLKGFMPHALRADGGLQPASDSTQTVRATHVAQVRRSAGMTDVVVVAQTSAGTRYLSVPVGRDARGLLYVAAYPAFVGPPATDTQVTPPTRSPVEDRALWTVVTRALRNYLAGEAANLRADLTPDAIVSLPPQALALGQIQDLSWLVPGRAVIARLQAADAGGDSLTLSYQLAVARRDRWYVDSIQFDPTLEGSS